MSKKKRKNNKPHDPAYMVRESDMRLHIDRLLKNDPLVQQAINEEVKRVSMIEFEEQEIDLWALFLLALRRSEKYGRKRLLRVACTLAELMKGYEEKYEDCDRFAMRLHLRDEVGIDVEHIEEEVEKFATQENTTKRRT